MITVKAAAIGLVLAGLAGCGNASASKPEVAPSASAVPHAGAVPSTQAAASAAMSASVTAARSVRVSGVYTWPHARLRINAGLFPGRMAGLLVDDGEPITVLGTGSTMDMKLTPALLRYFHRSAECARLCGRYVPLRRSLAQGYLRSYGLRSSEQVLQDTTPIGPKLVSVTYDGQRGLRWAAPSYGPGAYVIVAATPQCFPLKVDVPGHFVLTFSQWNQVPAPVAPSSVYRGSW